MDKIECPECGMRSVHPKDVAEGYCTRCHWWTGVPHLLAGWREKFPEKVAEAREFKAQLEHRRSLARARQVVSAFAPDDGLLDALERIADGLRADGG